MKVFLAILIVFYSSCANAQTFDELVKTIDSHSKIEAIKDKEQSVIKEGAAKSKWSEPQLKFDAMNLPSKDLAIGNSPMSSIGATISQQIPLTSRYSNIAKSYNSLSNVEKYKADILKRQIILGIWSHAIEKEKTIKSINIFKENLSWINGMIKVSNKLYSTGKVSQQAILDLKIRKSQINSDIKSNQISLQKLDKSLSKLLDLPNQNSFLQTNTIPWEVLENYLITSEEKTPQELLLQSNVEVLKHQQMASKQNKIPEINVGLNYKSRNNVDQHGDFIGGFISVPIGTGARSYQYQSSNYAYSKTKNDLKSYQNSLISFKEELGLEIKKLESELNILTSQTIKFAETSRKVSSKSYAVGNADYLELLRSELQLQNLLLQKIKIEGELKASKAQYLFESGLDMN